jgi:RES domain-containing protein
MAIEAIFINMLLWRIVDPRWAYGAFTGEGSAKNGGRYNEKDVFALYLGGDYLTALAEFNRDRPVTMHGAVFCHQFQVDRIIDLTNAETLASLGITQENLNENWRYTYKMARQTPNSVRKAIMD